MRFRGENMSGLIGLVLLAAVVAAYFLPAVIAERRKVPHAGSVTVINVFVGWTLLGWVVALAMACRDPRPALPPCYRCGAAASQHPGGRCPNPPALASAEAAPARWPHTDPGYRQRP